MSERTSNSVSADPAVTEQNRPLSVQGAAQDRSAPLKITGRLKRALDLIVWDNKTDNDAAAAVKMNVISIRRALRSSHVLAYYRQQKHLLRERESPRNIHALVRVRDQERNGMATVNAVKALEQLQDEPHTGAGAARQPGIVIVIGTGHQAPATVIDASPITDEQQGTSTNGDWNNRG